MSKDPSVQDTLWNLIKGIRFGMLVHRTTTGMLHAHPLTTQSKTLNAQSELHFFIPKNGELYERLQTEGQVNLSYADPGADSYVSLSGDASFSNDKALKESLWTPAAQAWFPEGVDDPNLALLVVRAHHAEYWDVKASKMVQLLKMAKAVVTGKEPSMGEHREINLS